MTLELELLGSYASFSVHLANDKGLSPAFTWQPTWGPSLPAVRAWKTGEQLRCHWGKDGHGGLPFLYRCSSQEAGWTQASEQ